MTTCNSGDPASRMVCDSNDGKPDDRLDHRDFPVHCCYKNMCNDVTKINLTFPIVNASTSHRSKGYWKCVAGFSWILLNVKINVLR